MILKIKTPLDLSTADMDLHIIRTAEGKSIISISIADTNRDNCSKNDIIYWQFARKLENFQITKDVLL